MVTFPKLIIQIYCLLCMTTYPVIRNKHNLIVSKLYSVAYCMHCLYLLTSYLTLCLSPPIDSDIILACSRLEQKFGVSDSALQWLKSYMSERQQAVTIRGIGSEKRTLEYGVPQGSVLGPELFKDYVAPLLSLIQSFGVNSHGYADDTQIYVPFVPG